MLSNYTIKQALPRLIIAAIAINLSYWISALAVDVSNLLGESIIALLTSISGDVINETSILAITEAFLMLGAAGAVAGAGIAAIAAAFITAPAFAGQLAVGVALLFLSILLGVAIAILVAVLILAARQALIVLLIFLSPIAFALYILPGTKPLFDRWQKLFTTMLVFYPLFALLYGGSLIAASVLIGMSGDADARLAGVFLLMGFTAQFAPLIMTPWLLKNSSGFLGKIGERIQSRGRALTAPVKKMGMSQTKQAGAGAFKSAKAGFMGAKFSRLPDGSRRKRALRALQTGEARRRAALGAADAKLEAIEEEHMANDKIARNYNQEKMTAQQEKKKFADQGETDWKRTGDGAGAIYAAKTAEGEKKAVDTQLDIEHQQATEGLQLTQKALDQELSVVKAGYDTTFEELKSEKGREQNPHIPDAFGVDIGADARKLALLQQRQSGAKRVVEDKYAKDVRESRKLAEYAGGIDPGGATRAQAVATQQYFERLNQAVAQERTLMTGVGPEEHHKGVFDTSKSLETRMAHAAELASSGYMGGKLDLERDLRARMAVYAEPIRRRIREDNKNNNLGLTDKQIEARVEDELVELSKTDTELDTLRDLQQQYDKDISVRPFAQGDTTRQALSRGVASMDLHREFATRVVKKLKGGSLPKLKIEEVEDLGALMDGRLTEQVIDANGNISQKVIQPTAEHVAGIRQAVTDLNASPQDLADITPEARKELERILAKSEFAGLTLGGSTNQPKSAGNQQSPPSNPGSTPPNSSGSPSPSSPPSGTPPASGGGSQGNLNIPHN